MPYPRAHKQRTRERILINATRLFASQGFTQTSIEEIMAHSELTRGAFYAHFRSKAGLYKEAMFNPSLAENWDSGEWSFLATDVANSAPEVRIAYEKAVKLLYEKVKARLRSRHHPEGAALSSAAMIVGMLAIGATVDDAVFRDSVVAACTEHLAAMEEDARYDRQQTFFWSAYASDFVTPIH